TYIGTPFPAAPRLVNRPLLERRPRLVPSRTSAIVGASLARWTAAFAVAATGTNPQGFHPNGSRPTRRVQTNERPASLAVVRMRPPRCECSAARATLRQEPCGLK